MMQATHNPLDDFWIFQQLAEINEDFHAMARAGYASRYQQPGIESENRRTANNWLLDTVEELRLESGSKRLVSHERLAQLSGKMIHLFGLDEAAEWARAKGVHVPPCPKDEIDPHQPNSRAALKSRLCSPDWWEKQLTKKHRKDAEAAQIRAGNVCKGESPYVSSEAVANFQWRQQQLEAWKKQVVLISNEGDEVSLDSADHEHAAAFVRFAEFMVRINGMSAIAAENYVTDDVLDTLPDSLKRGAGGAFADVSRLAAFDAADPESWVGIGFTLTTPSRFHRYSTRDGKLTLNKHYDATQTPADARDWLQETWKLTQTAWKRATKHIQPVGGFGFRMDEAHHDGVSHYHYGIWVQAKDAQRATQMFYDKALRGEFTDRVKQQSTCQFGKARDAKENGAAVRRLNFKVMTSAAGMVSYMVKYITKGLTGADWEDLKAGVPADQTILNIMARKNVWGLRQYAFWNAPSVMAWRELRRLDDEQANTVLEVARLAAKAGDWKAYTEANGGAACPARARPIGMMRTTKQDAETGQDALNQYGETINQIRGLLVNGVEIRTRLKDWYLLNIGSLEKLLVEQFMRESDTARSDLQPAFSSDLQAVIAQAKEQGKLHRLADRAGVAMFPSSSSSSGGSPPLGLGLVGLTSHDKNQRAWQADEREVKL
ncbi:MAG: replication endonuclease [Thiothrix litoralis]